MSPQTHALTDHDAEFIAGVDLVTGFPLEGTFRVLPLADLVESPYNPRHVFDATKLQELADSIREKGIVEPLVVRPLPVDFSVDRPAFEIVAGARRFRASKLAGRTDVPCVIRVYSDEDVLELFLIENVQRDDLAPLEQARGFKQLLDANPDKYSPATIATRVGMSAAWVWDRLKLLDLVPEATELLEQGRISIGHGILLARLKPEDQQRAIELQGGGLWATDYGRLALGDNPNDDQDPYIDQKPRSIRELQAWIDDHVRFDVLHAAQAQPLVFEPVAQQVESALAAPGRGRKVIAITFEHHVPQDARAEERTFGPRSFKLADGQPHTGWNGKTDVAPECQHSVLGVVAVGPRRGEAIDVCIAREKCDIHWGEERAEKQKVADLRATGDTKQASRVEKAAETRAAKEREKEQRAIARWSVVYPKLSTAARAAAAASPEKLKPAVYAALLKHYHLPSKTKPAQLAKALLVDWIHVEFHGGYKWYGQERQLAEIAKVIGVNVKRVLATDEDGQAAPAKATATKTAPGKKGRRVR